MNSKLIMLVLNAIYLIATIIWAIIDKSAESFVAIVGGTVSFVSFFIANDNSFKIRNKNSIIQKGNNSISVIGDVSKSNIGNTTNNKL